MASDVGNLSLLDSALGSEASGLQVNTLPRGEVNLLLSLEGSAPVRGSQSLRLTLRGPRHGGLGFNGGGDVTGWIIRTLTR